MSKQQVKRISEVLGDRWAELPRKIPTDILGQDFYIMEVQKRQGRLGEYLVIRARSEEGEDFIVSTGAHAVISDINRVEAQLPLIARFEQKISKSGRKYLYLV